MKNMIYAKTFIIVQISIVQSAGAVEYTNCTSAEG